MMLAISLATHSDTGQRTQVQLESLLDQHDLRPWQWTDTLVIRDGAVPHSHPMLTLHTRHLDDDSLLLATYVHEQLHWFVSGHHEQVRAAVAELKGMYAQVPVGYPRGAKDEYSSYVHYLICFLEYVTLQRLVDQREARRIIDFWCGDHYTDIYAAVLRDGPRIGAVIPRHGLSDCTLPA